MYVCMYVFDVQCAFLTGLQAGDTIHVLIQNENGLWKGTIFGGDGKVKADGLLSAAFISVV
jgi:hypothetical protein